MDLSTNRMFIDGYFCICPDCGSIDWTEMNLAKRVHNSLEKDGSLLLLNYFGFTRNSDFSKIQVLNRFNIPNDLFGIFCVDCEKALVPIRIRDVNLKIRMQIVKMSPEMRIEWLKSFQIIQELEE